MLLYFVPVNDQNGAIQFETKITLPFTTTAVLNLRIKRRKTDKN